MLPQLADFAGDFHIDERLVEFGFDAVLFLPSAVDRWGFIVSPLSGGPLRISTKGRAGADNGLSVGSMTDPFSMTFRDWGALVQMEWWGRTLGAVEQVTVIEVFLRSKG